MRKEDKPRWSWEAKGNLMRRKKLILTAESPIKSRVLRHKACFYQEVEKVLKALNGLVKSMHKKSKNNHNDYRKPAKTYWHIYGLQTLSSDKFVKVVNKILRREYILIK